MRIKLRGLVDAIKDMKAAMGGWSGETYFKTFGANVSACCHLISGHSCMQQYVLVQDNSMWFYFLHADEKQLWILTYSVGS